MLAALLAGPRQGWPLCACFSACCHPCPAPQTVLPAATLDLIQFLLPAAKVSKCYSMAPMFLVFLQKPCILEYRCVPWSLLCIQPSLHAKHLTGSAFTRGGGGRKALMSSQSATLPYTQETKGAPIPSAVPSSAVRIARRLLVRVSRTMES